MVPARAAGVRRVLSWRNLGGIQVVLEPVTTKNGSDIIGVLLEYGGHASTTYHPEGTLTAVQLKKPWPKDVSFVMVSSMESVCRLKSVPVMFNALAGIGDCSTPWFVTMIKTSAAESFKTVEFSMEGFIVHWMRSGIQVVAFEVAAGIIGRTDPEVIGGLDGACPSLLDVDIWVWEAEGVEDEEVPISSFEEVFEDRLVPGGGALLVFVFAGGVSVPLEDDELGRGVLFPFVEGPEEPEGDPALVVGVGDSDGGSSPFFPFAETKVKNNETLKPI